MARTRTQGVIDSDKKYYKKNKERILEQMKIRYDSNREVLRSIKQQAGCVRCGFREPVALDFHHTSPDEKEFNIAQEITRSLSSLLKEVDKCIVICANCHRMLHEGLWKIEDIYDS